PQLIDLTLSSHHAKLIKWKSEKHLDDIVDLINQGSIQQQNWHYIFRLSVKLERNKWTKRLAKGDHFIAELSRQMKGVGIQSQLTDLFNHPQGRKYLEKFSATDESAIKSEARQLLMNELLKNE